MDYFPRILIVTLLVLYSERGTDVGVLSVGLLMCLGQPWLDRRCPDGTTLKLFIAEQKHYLQRSYAAFDGTRPRADSTYITMGKSTS